MRLSLTLFLFLAVTVSASAQTHVGLTLTSTHYVEGEYNEINPGVIIEGRVPREGKRRVAVRKSVGAYRNSFDRLSLLGGGSMAYPSGALVQGKIMFGLVSGYPSMFLMPMLSPSLRIGRERGVELHALPGAFAVSVYFTIN